MCSPARRKDEFTSWHLLNEIVSRKAAEQCAELAYVESAETHRDRKGHHADVQQMAPPVCRQTLNIWWTQVLK